MASELLARMYIGDMYLHGRHRHGTQRVGYGMAVMGICPGIDHDAVTIAREAHFLDIVDKGSLGIALEIVNPDIGSGRAQGGKVFVEGA